MGRYPRERIEARLHLFAIDGAHRVFGVSRMPLQLHSSPSRFCDGKSGFAVMYAAQTCWMANQLALISETVSPENVATLLSLSALGGGLGGIVSNLLTGWAVPTIGYVPVFTTFGCLHLAAFGILILCMRRAASASR